jgi:tRNA G10  N-methylase Trm11
MIGGGTTTVEYKLLNRNLLALDINPNALELTKSVLNFECEHNPKIKLAQKDARNIEMLKDKSIDFALMHPPYADIIKYSDDIDGDLSHIHDLDRFCDEIEKVAAKLLEY